MIHEPSGPTPTSQYEHSSIPATVKKLFNLKNSNFLTKRDAWAGTFEKYFYMRDTPREDCPGIPLYHYVVRLMFHDQDKLLRICLFVYALCSLKKLLGIDGQRW